MGSFADWGKVAAFVADKYDKISGFVKRKKRLNEIKKQDKMVDSNDDAALDAELQRIRQKSDDRKNTT